MSLGMAALQAIPALAGTEDTGFAWTIYTGDLVSHDAENQLSRYVFMISVQYERKSKCILSHRAYVEYTEVTPRETRSDSRSDLTMQTILYGLFKRMLGSGPVYAALGNHDTYNQLVFSSDFRSEF
jgi:sphingomyelin phosphodiesterase